MSPRCSLALFVALFSLPAACDGTLAGIGHEPRAPEPPLEAAEEESARSDTPSEIAASHLLVMHQGSRSATRAITRTREEARARAEEARARILGGEDFAAMVAEYSEEPGAAAREGALGRFSRGMMVRPFADAAFALDVGEVSEVVETAFGFHVIKRTE